jgi:hypothetical protein
LTCGGTGTGNSAPAVAITQPDASLRYKVGDLITYAGQATDVEDGTLPASALAWSIVLHHCPGGSCHAHPFTTNTGTSGSFTIPDHGDESYFELILTATDSAGLTGRASRTIQPLTAQLTLQTSPSGLQVVYGGTSGVSPMVKHPIVGSTVTVYAPSPQNGLTFGSWSDGGAQQHNVVVDSDTVLTATFGGSAIPPTVTATSPAANATNVNTNVTITATFSQDMDASSINAGTVFVTPQGAATPVAAEVTYDAASRTARLRPSARLLNGTVYIATVRGGTGGVKDRAGNAMQADKVWSFTTRGKR